MTISERAYTEIMQLIQEGKSLDPFDSVAFHRWMDSSHEALEFDPVQQERFHEYCRSSYGYASMRLYIGVWLLKQSLFVAEEAPEGHYPTTFLSNQ